MDMQTEDTTAEENRQIAIISEQMLSLADANFSMDTIASCLGDIEREYPEAAPVLDELYDAAGALVTNNHALRETLSAAAALAQQFRAQREAAQQSLAELREKIDNCDLSDPGIEALAESIEEWQMESIYMYIDDQNIENVWNATPLEYSEAAALLGILNGENLPEDHPLWQELKSWIERAERAALEAFKR